MNNAQGRCYERAFRYLKKIPEGCVFEYRLVHGQLLGTAGEVKGIIFGHAWIEGELVVIDPSSNPRKPNICLKDVFYSHYKIDKNKVKKYTLLEAYKAGLAAGGNDGPWE